MDIKVNKMIRILDSDLKLRAILRKVTSSVRTEAINDENTLNFTTFVSLKTNQYLTEDSVIELDGDYFDIARMEKDQKENGSCMVQAETEHISYRLNDPEYNMSTFASTGTPTAVLTDILAGTPFTVGTVEFTAPVTYSASEAKSRRALLMEFADYIGAELDFDKFVISLVAHRGNAAPVILSPNKNIKVVSQILDKRNTDSSGNPLISYTCTPIGGNLHLGDEVLLIQKKLDIQEQLRIVCIVTDPYDKSKVSVEIANRIETLEDAIYEIQTTTLVKGKAYNSCSISAENGFMSVRGDGLAKSVVNATEGFSLYSGEGLERNFYVDTDGKIKAKEIDIDGSGTFAGALVAASGTFAGALVAATGTFSGSITIGTGDNIFKANGSDGIWLGDADFEDAPFSVDLEGNLIAHDGKFVGGSIYAGKLYGPSETSGYIQVGEEGTSKYAAFNMYRNNGTNVFGIYDGLTYISLKRLSNDFLVIGATGATAEGDWSFSGITNKQTATLLDGSATLSNVIVKINGILNKLDVIGLFDVS